MTKDTPKTYAEVEIYAAQNAIDIDPEDRAVAAEAGALRQQEVIAALTSNEAHKSAWVDRFNKAYPKFLAALHGMGDVSITLVHTTLVGPGVLLMLIMLLIVEQQRVFHGVSLFEAHPALAAFSAWALVILNLSLELLISYVEHRAKWVEPPKHQFSLVLFARRLAYIAGRTTDWQPLPKSPAIRFRTVLRIVTFSILIIALAGSMRSVIERTEGNWLKALWIAVSDSTLLDMATWAGGLLYAFAAVWGAQALSQYAARKAIEIGALLASDKPHLALEAAGLSAAAALLARVKAKQRLQRAGASAAEGIRENVETVPERTGITGTLMPSTRKALKWLGEHPHTGMTVQQIMGASGMSRGTVQRGLEAEREGYHV